MTKSGGAFDDMHVSVTQAFQEALRAREEGAVAERRRIRLAILSALRGLRLAFMSESSSRNALNEYANTIDRATKAPKRKATKGPA